MPGTEQSRFFISGLRSLGTWGRDSDRSRRRAQGGQGGGGAESQEKLPYTHTGTSPWGEVSDF